MPQQEHMGGALNRLRRIVHTLIQRNRNIRLEQHLRVSDTPPSLLLLPPELVICIFECIAGSLVDRDIDDLKSCSMICKALLPSAQRQLFSSLTLTIGPHSLSYQRALTLVRASPHLVSYIQSLYLDFGVRTMLRTEPLDEHHVELDTLASLLTNVQSVRFYYRPPVHLTQARIPGEPVLSDRVPALAALFRRVTSLQLDGFFYPHDENILSFFPSLRILRVGAVRVGLPVLRPQPPAHFRALHDVCLGSAEDTDPEWAMRLLDGCAADVKLHIAVSRACGRGPDAALLPLLERHGSQIQSLDFFWYGLDTDVFINSINRGVLHVHHLSVVVAQVLGPVEGTSTLMQVIAGMPKLHSLAIRFPLTTQDPDPTATVIMLTDLVANLKSPRPRRIDIQAMISGPTSTFVNDLCAAGLTCFVKKSDDNAMITAVYQKRHGRVSWMEVKITELYGGADISIRDYN